MSARLTALVLACAAVVQAPAATATAAGWPACIPRRAPIRIGIREVARSRHGRLETLTLHSRAMQEDQRVDVLLPARFDPSGRARYHVLYLLHGAGGDYRSWIRDGIERRLGGLPVIAVMPSGSERGVDGGYSDWYGTPPGWRRPAPAWESYHVRELVPYIDAHFPTIASAAGRAVAGLSMGGGGAIKYAAEYPGTFGYAATFSGEVHPLLPVAVGFQPKTCKWGNPAAEQVVWRDNDAADLAGNLRGVRVFVRSGTGVPGPFDSPTRPLDPIAGAVWQLRLLVEYGAHLESEALVRALERHRVREVDVRFFPGSHSAPYWHRDMRELVAWLRRQFRRPPRPPRGFEVISAHRWFSAWGWTFTVRRRVRELLHVRVRRDRITLVGSGTVRVTAPGGRRLTVRLGARRGRIRPTPRARAVRT